MIHVLMDEKIIKLIYFMRQIQKKCGISPAFKNTAHFLVTESIA
ncbi:conserved protein of unknown function [Lactiplantibacillus plantarum]|uniref:Uncharacterized protein n=1 Tax=Lactiplantibacillus plantarum WJL TaxID=1350466 RepID=A0A837P5D2_LACPN|nr:hypothetical protein HMPREF0531_12861 [Lactiplantibacillus plantarum subsp. plantarum ATCC 14917 = JCM 1149 = CGMCC 1.2437]ERJ52444.1 hypothetical protein N574_10670 [Lactiplantibacillus plantarum 2165]ERO40557.1 hypothetical protein LPLWJ_23290 [Lactiplantibacillus plantarum WJL]KPN42889.1 hypothetical protein WJL_1925 [Lactiplantibacillus plantarum WJL]WCL70116.1 hypothetical protein MWLp12_2765 [Lactiplantibacillus plantarum]